MDNWDEAFDEFYGGLTDEDKEEEVDVKSDDDDAKADAAKDDKSGDAADDAADDEPQADNTDDTVDADDTTKAGDDGAADDAKGDESDDKAAADATTETDDDEEAKAQKDVTKAAINEFFSEREKETQEVMQQTEEAVQLLYPNGIPDPRVDSDGDRITSVAQVEKLVNPRTQELFTPSEAREWYDAATKQYETSLQAARTEAQTIVQENRQLQKEQAIVQRVYGDFLAKHPEKAEQALNSFKRTLILAPDGKYIQKVPVSMLEHYNNVIQPQVELFESLTEKAVESKQAVEAKQAQVAKQKAARDENVDLKQSQPDNVGGDPDDWSKAFDNYYGVRTRR